VMWKDAYLESRILSANPLELVSLLYQGALDSVHDARKYLEDGDIPARSKAISKVMDILSELEASLNHQAGGSISRGLADLYQYMRLRLLEANIKRDDAILAEVQSLLATMAEAWRGIQRSPEARDEPAAEVAVGPYPPPATWDGAFDAGSGSEFAAHGWNA
jgi:flagellar protein FliS